MKNLARWLIPGLGIKRWLAVLLAGTTLLGIGFGVWVLEMYRTAPQTWWLPALSYLALRFLARPLRVLIFGTLGAVLMGLGIWGMNRALLAPFRTPGDALVDAVAAYRKRERGARIVAVGGGHGLSNLLRGLKGYSHNITAVVTVADDGGSSGRLRESLGILPPGDIRNCLAALSNDEALLTQLFQYRFGDNVDGLEGHSFGNLFISALSEIMGSFEDAVAESGRVLSVHGRVLPATLHNVHLMADVRLPHTTSAVRVRGESRIPEVNGRVQRVWLDPGAPPAYPKVIQAILAADLIVIGPGSLYTSILPDLLVPDIVQAINASRALKIFVCNIANQPGETDGYTCSDYLQAIEAHTGSQLVDLVLVNQTVPVQENADFEWVRVDAGIGLPVHRADLINAARPWQHDSLKLADTLMALLAERTGPLAG
ncbi:MAG: YvcK family protein [Anaerolineales bacterium]